MQHPLRTILSTLIYQFLVLNNQAASKAAVSKAFAFMFWAYAKILNSKA